MYICVHARAVQLTSSMVREGGWSTEVSSSLMGSSSSLCGRSGRSVGTLSSLGCWGRETRKVPYNRF